MSEDGKRFMPVCQPGCRGWLPSDDWTKRQKDCCFLQMIRNGRRELRRRNHNWKKFITCKSAQWRRTICCGRLRLVCSAAMAKCCEPRGAGRFGRAKRTRGSKLCSRKARTGRFEGCWKHAASKCCG